MKINLDKVSFPIGDRTFTFKEWFGSKYVCIDDKWEFVKVGVPRRGEYMLGTWQTSGRKGFSGVRCNSTSWRTICIIVKKAPK